MTPEKIQKILASPSQLATLVYDTWGVPFDKRYCLTDPSKTYPEGRRSVNKKALTFLIEEHLERFPQLLLVKEYRGIKSKLDKFVAGPKKAKEYLGSEVMHHCGRVNSTYTGRGTVSSKVTLGGQTDERDKCVSSKRR
jgi:hypothetical protein